MQKTIVSFWVLGMVFIPSHYVLARPYSPVDLAHDATEADVICTGQVIERKITSPSDTTPVSLSLTFKVDRVHKGKLAGGETINITYSEHNPDLCPDQELTNYDLLLLRKNASSYTFMRLTDSTMPLAQKAYSPYVASDDVNKNLEWEMVNSLQDTTSAIRNAALQQTRLLSKENLVKYVEPLAASSDKAICEAALTGLAIAGDWRPGLEYILKNPSKSDTETNRMSVLEAHIESCKITAADVPTVARLLSSNSPVLRRIGSYMLRKSECNESFQYLKSVLDDSAPEVQYNAIMGLAGITHDSKHTMTYEEFLKDKDQYTSYWKQKELQ